MTIPLTINNKKAILDVDPVERLVYTLRNAGFLSVKKGCIDGACGSCTVLIDKKPVPSCIVPAVFAKDSSIETLEYFEQTADYEDIKNGFAKAGIHLCGFCNASKIFTAFSILQTYTHPNREDLLDAVSHLIWCCTDKDTYINGILLATIFRNKRLEALRNVRK